ncbi:MAG: tetratricopeptide repeat protein [Fimbriimonadaceae bacterium]
MKLTLSSLFLLTLGAYSAFTTVGCRKPNEAAVSGPAIASHRLSDQLTKATQLLNNGLQDQAEQMVNDQLKSDPSNADAYIVMAALQLKKGDTHKAADPYLTAALKLQPDWKPEVFAVIGAFGAGEDCSLAGVEFKLSKFDGRPDPAPLLAFALRTDKHCYVQDEKLALALANDKLISPDEFLGAFPDSQHAPALLWSKASELLLVNSSAAKKLYQRLAASFPESDEGKDAAKKLADWWEHSSISLPLDNQWHLVHQVERGTRYRLSISGNVRIDMGALGYTDLTPAKAMGYIGTSATWPRSPGYFPSNLGVDGLRAILNLSDQDIEQRSTEGMAPGFQTAEQFKRWKAQDARTQGNKAAYTYIRNSYFLPGASSQGIARSGGALYLAVDSNQYEGAFNVDYYWQETSEGSGRPTNPASTPRETRPPFQLSAAGWSESRSIVDRARRVTLTKGPSEIFVEWRATESQDPLTYPASVDSSWNQKKKAGYSKFRLERDSFHGTPAVIWEYLRLTPNGSRHRLVYYLNRGSYSYAIAAESDSPRWASEWTGLKTVIDSISLTH